MTKKPKKQDGRVRCNFFLEGEYAQLYRTWRFERGIVTSVPDAVRMGFLALKKDLLELDETEARVRTLQQSLEARESEELYSKSKRQAGEGRET